MKRIEQFEVEFDDVTDVPMQSPIAHVGAAGDGLALVELAHADARTAFVLPALKPGATRGVRQAWLLAVEAEILRWCPSCRRVSVDGAPIAHAGGCLRHERRYALWLAVEPPLRVMAATVRQLPWSEKKTPRIELESGGRKSATNDGATSRTVHPIFVEVSE